VQVQKKKIWEEVQPDLRTDANKAAGYKGALMLTSAGPVVAATLANGNIS
jgi:aminoacyl tRNA synthase complex-interacting multifunctional protein 1